MSRLGLIAKTVGSVSSIVALLIAVAFPVSARAQAPERLEGLLASTAAVAGLARIRIQIEEYTTDQETQEFVDILRNEGWRALEGRFLKIEKGRFIRVGQLGHNIAFARTFTHDTGRIIRLATARPIAFAEMSRQTRSREHAFGLIELRLDQEGKGSGVVWAAASLEFNDEGQLEIESYGNPPFSITTIELKD